MLKSSAMLHAAQRVKVVLRASLSPIKVLPACRAQLCTLMMRHMNSAGISKDIGIDTYMAFVACNSCKVESKDATHEPAAPLDHAQLVACCYINSNIDTQLAVFPDESNKYNHFFEPLMLIMQDKQTKIKPLGCAPVI